MTKEQAIQLINVLLYKSDQCYAISIGEPDDMYNAGKAGAYMHAANLIAKESGIDMNTIR
jgi:hypothetical protein